jgi:hypothetical protein
MFLCFYVFMFLCFYVFMFLCFYVFMFLCFFSSFCCFWGACFVHKGVEDGLCPTCSGPTVWRRCGLSEGGPLGRTQEQLMQQVCKRCHLCSSLFHFNNLCAIGSTDKRLSRCAAAWMLCKSRLEAQDRIGNFCYWAIQRLTAKIS